MKRKPNEMRAVLKQLRKITHNQINPLLDAKHQLDPNVGIVIVKLNVAAVGGDIGQRYEFYTARVLPATKENPNYVNPHYHLVGSEPYRFLSDTAGEMNIGTVKNNEVIWNSKGNVVQGDEVIINGGEVHSFRNTGSVPADFVFSCPPNHLVDNNPEHPEGDRYFTKNLKNGIPLWYPKK